MKKKINYMGVSELMRMIIISVTLFELKKKSHKDSEAKNIQINFHCKVKELLQWRITGLNVNIMTQYVCFVFGNCNHCCFCCGHPFTMLGVSLFISCKNKILCVCVCVCVCVKKKMDYVKTCIKLKIQNETREVIFFCTHGKIFRFPLQLKLISTIFKIRLLF